MGLLAIQLISIYRHVVDSRFKKPTDLITVKGGKQIGAMLLGVMVVKARFVTGRVALGAAFHFEPVV